MSNKFKLKIEYIKNELGCKNLIITKKFIIGNTYNAILIYIKVLSNKEVIDRDILYPLMFNTMENIIKKDNMADIICKKYIPMASTSIDNNIDNIIKEVKSGKSVILFEDIDDYIIINNTGGEYRTISEPINESAIRGTREGFIENIETNIGMLRRNIKDKNLEIENFIIGKRSQTDVAIVYIKDIADLNLINEIKKRLECIETDYVTSGMIEQYIEDSPYSIFPQIFGTERPDVVEANIMEGKAAIITNGTPYVLTAPACFIEFFQAVEDYYQRTIISSFQRILRVIAAFISITLPAIYLALIRFNGALIPIKFIQPIVKSREGIALTPFLEILSLELIVELLREGGLRLPSKVAQTLSIVGGIIIGDTAIESKIVSPTTLLIVGISVVATFLIPNYDMALVVRFLRFPMLLLANILGLYGIAAGCFFLIAHLSSLKSFNTPYFDIKESDLKDIFIRAPLYKMDKRPVWIPGKDKKRKTQFRKKWWKE